MGIEPMSDNVGGALNALLQHMIGQRPSTLWGSLKTRNKALMMFTHRLPVKEDLCFAKAEQYFFFKEL